MVTRKITCLGVLVALVLSFGANAETKRYLVKFKSEKTFHAMAQSIKPSLWDAARGELAPMRLFNTNASVSQALEKVELLVIESDDAKAIASLRKHPAIALVEEEIMHPLPRRVAARAVAATSPRPEGMEMPWGISAVRAPEAWQSTRGAGTRVLVLDTGIEKEHQALLTRFEKGKNFTTSDSADYADSMGHGTHVAGTILADGQAGGLVGVAPDAKVLAGKVCGDIGCSSVAIAGGINWAIEEDVDVVNMSLGGFFISEAEAQALRRAEAAGVFIAAASGNDGTGRVSYPAAIDTILAVGAVNPDLTKADFSQWGPELDVVGPGVDVMSSVPRGTGRSAMVKLDLGKGEAGVKSLPFVGSPLRDGRVNDVVFAGLGKPEDFNGIDVKGKYALISRGEIAFAEKVMNAIQNGALGVLIYNNAPGLLQGQLSEDGSEAAIPAVMIEQTTGELARQALSEGQRISASIAIEASDFAAFQGTSMAAPHVAGVAALVRAANPALTPEQVREVLKATARPLTPNDENHFGAGIVDAEAAVARAKAMASVELRQVAN